MKSGSLRSDRKRAIKELLARNTMAQERPVKRGKDTISSCFARASNYAQDGPDSDSNDDSTHHSSSSNESIPPPDTNE